MKAYDKTDKAILIHTPTITAILIDSQKLLVANVGESIVVLRKNGKFIQLSVDHEPSKARGSIENRGVLSQTFQVVLTSLHINESKIFLKGRFGGLEK